MTLALQAALFSRSAPTAVAPTTAPAAQPTSPPAPSATPAPPAPTQRPLAEGIARQEIADLHAEIDRLWTTTYLLKAISQVAEAEELLNSNDMQGVDQSLVSADYALALAYERADEPAKSPIDQFRRNVDRMRGDLYLYPERMDSRLSQLRQLLLALIEERQ